MLSLSRSARIALITQANSRQWLAYSPKKADLVKLAMATAHIFQAALRGERHLRAEVAGKPCWIRYEAAATTVPPVRTASQAWTHDRAAANAFAEIGCRENNSRRARAVFTLAQTSRAKQGRQGLGH